MTVSRLKSALAAAATAAVLVAAALAPSLHAQPAAKSEIPDLSTDKLWVLMNGTAYFKAPGDTGPGPVMQRGKDYAHDDVPRIAETNNPILKPWAKKLMDINNARVVAGGIPFYTTSRC